MATKAEVQRHVADVVKRCGPTVKLERPTGMSGAETKAHVGSVLANIAAEHALLNATAAKAINKSGTLDSNKQV